MPELLPWLLEDFDPVREVLAGAASLALFAGSYFLGSKRRGGWWYMVAGNLLWTSYGIYDRAVVIIAESIVFQALALRGWLKWRKGHGAGPPEG